LFFSFVRTKSHAENPEVEAAQSPKLRDFAKVLKSKNNWLLTFYSGLAFSPLAVLGGLWGNPFFESVYHFSPTDAASVSTFMFLGLAVGAPLFALLSNRLNNRYGVMQLGVWLSFTALVAVLYLPSLNTVMAATLLFLFGLGVGAFMLGFTLCKELNSLALAATVVAFVNTGDALLDAVTEPFVGKLLDHFWTGDVVNGVHHFGAHDYHLAFVVLPLYLLAASLCLVPLRKACKMK
jgi:sugar phosphate permease